jgi:MerR family redox-sensitive transcriptional activator SoxR
VDKLLTIHEISRRSGVASSALRFYETRGLIRSERSGAGHRRFPRAALRRIAFIVFAQRVGLSLEEIGEELAKLPAQRTPTGRDWARLSSAWSSRIDARIAELERGPKRTGSALLDRRPRAQALNVDPRPATTRKA